MIAALVDTIGRLTVVATLPTGLVSRIDTCFHSLSLAVVGGMIAILRPRAVVALLAAIVGAAVLSAIAAIAAIAAGFGMPVVRAAITAFLVLPIIPATLRERGGRNREGNGEQSKELCHTYTAWLTNTQ